MSKTLTLLALVTAFACSTESHAMSAIFGSKHASKCKEACHGKASSCKSKCERYLTCLESHPDGKRTGKCPKPDIG